MPRHGDKRRPPSLLAEQLRQFGEALPAPATWIVVGGAAGGLAFGVTRETTDVDIVMGLTNEHCVLGQPFGLELSHCGVCQLPEDCEAYFIRFQFGALTVLIPQLADWVLSKLDRFNDHDEEVILEVAPRLDTGHLIKRYNEQGYLLQGSHNIRRHLINLLRTLGVSQSEDMVRQPY